MAAERKSLEHFSEYDNGRKSQYAAQFAKLRVALRAGEKLGQLYYFEYQTRESEIVAGYLVLDSFANVVRAFSGIGEAMDPKPTG